MNSSDPPLMGESLLFSLYKVPACCVQPSVEETPPALMGLFVQERLVHIVIHYAHQHTAADEIA
jgi:hypothetical protein